VRVGRTAHAARLSGVGLADGRGRGDGHVRIARLRLHPIRVQRETGVANDHVIVSIETDAGAEGWGEMSALSPLPHYQFDVPQLESALQEILVGADPRDVNRIERQM